MKFLTKVFSILLITNFLCMQSSWPAQAMLERMTLNKLVDAIINNDLECVQKILKNLPKKECRRILHAPFERDYEGELWNWNVLALAVRASNSNFVQLFIKYGANVDEQIFKPRFADDVWVTPLYFAVENDYADILKLLLPHTKFLNGWAARLTNGKLLTPLAVAAYCSSLESIKLLHKRGADFFHGSNYIDSLGRKRYESVAQVAFSFTDKIKKMPDVKECYEYESDDEDPQFLPARKECLEVAVEKYAARKLTTSRVKRKRLNPEPEFVLPKLPAYYVQDSPVRKPVDQAKQWVPGPYIDPTPYY